MNDTQLFQALEDLFQACEDLPLKEMNRMEKEIAKAATALEAAAHTPAPMDACHCSSKFAHHYEHEQDPYCSKCGGARADRRGDCTVYDWRYKV